MTKDDKLQFEEEGSRGEKNVGRWRRKKYFLLVGSRGRCNNRNT